MRSYSVFSPGLPSGDLEDCGAFCVWWYTQPVRGKTDQKRWAFALRGPDGNTWRTSNSTSGFVTRDDAVSAGRMATYR